MLRQKIRIQTTDDRGFEVQEEKGQVNRLQIKHFRIPHSLLLPPSTVYLSPLAF
jgi:hypothetical protein